MFLETGHYYLSSFLIQRIVALVYLTYFIDMLREYHPLYGNQGLKPLSERVGTNLVQEISPFKAADIDRLLYCLLWAGALLSLFALIGISEWFGTTISFIIWLILWSLLIISYNSAEKFNEYNFSQLLLIELGLIVILFSGLTREPLELAIWLCRWALFRLMVGAGLAKLGSESKWASHLRSHFETQPFPNTLSWFLYQTPKNIHYFAAKVVVYVQILVPLLYFFPQPYAAVGGLVTLGLQLVIFPSGNYSKINLLAIAAALSTINDRMLSWVVKMSISPGSPSEPLKVLSIIIFILVIIFSYKPMKIMISGEFRFFKYTYFPIVNYYFLYTNIPSERRQIVIEGTDDELDGSPEWREYGFYERPNKPTERPRQVAPFNYNLEYHLHWEAEREQPSQWMEELLLKLTDGSSRVDELTRDDPFPENSPKYARAVMYKYEFTTYDERRQTGKWWNRRPLSVFHPPVSAITERND